MSRIWDISFHPISMRVCRGRVRMLQSVAYRGPSFHPMFMRVWNGSRFHSPGFAYACRIQFAFLQPNARAQDFEMSHIGNALRFCAQPQDYVFTLQILRSPAGYRGAEDWPRVED
jgi:hypothetical protein